jgi:hypothetical protein
MDRGSDSNLIYWDTFEKLNIGIEKLCPARGLITSVVPGQQVMPLGIVDPKATFGDAVNVDGQ